MMLLVVLLAASGVLAALYCFAGASRPRRSALQRIARLEAAIDGHAIALQHVIDGGQSLIATHTIAAAETQRLRRFLLTALESERALTAESLRRLEAELIAALDALRAAITGLPGSGPATPRAARCPAPARLTLVTDAGCNESAPRPCDSEEGRP